jgi:hypothetical protein
MHLGASGEKRLGARIRTSQANYLVACFNKFRNNSRADETCSTGNKDTHGSTPLISVLDGHS